MKRGPKKGSKHLGGMHSGSAASRLTAMEVGERRYLETTLAEYANVMSRAVLPRSRRPPVLRTREFSTRLYTAVSSSAVGDIRFLVCVERTE